MKVVFMGTPDFAVGTLEEIVKAGHEVVAVVTQPDKPKGPLHGPGCRSFGGAYADRGAGHRGQAGKTGSVKEREADGYNFNSKYRKDIHRRY